MSLTREEKQRIAARAFYAENRDEFESFDQALEDFAEGKISETFLDKVVEMNCQRQEGAALMMSPGGHLANVFPHGYFEPITDMSEEEGEMIQAGFAKAAEFCSSKRAKDLLEFMGWKEVPQAFLSKSGSGS